MKRWLDAFRNSLNALRYGFRNEKAIREEIFALGLAIIFAPIIANSFLHSLIMIGSVLFLISIEALNTAIERLADKVSIESDPLIGISKDYGSLAVLAALIITCIIWIEAIYKFLDF